MIPLATLLAAAMKSDSPFFTFHASVKQQLAEGVDREVMIAKLNALVNEATDPAAEEVVQCVLDAFFDRLHKGMRL